MKYIWLFLIMILLTACPKTDHYQTCDIPDNPVNLSEFNTQYDDYNSTGPMGNLIPFCFSTNRNSQGQDFDVIYMPMNIYFDKTTGILTVTEGYGSWGQKDIYENIPKAIERIKSSANELGPYLQLDNAEGYLSQVCLTLSYASDESGNFDIKFTSNVDDTSFSVPAPVSFLNSPHNDLYPSVTKENSRIYFCSDRDNGNFDIYYTDISKTYPNYADMFTDTTIPHIIRKEEILSGSSADKCPFIFGNYMIFASDRTGGYGGFDLYYAVYENSKWSQPVNFGSKINSQYDEYRPILIFDGLSWNETMMIFSSNRPGGKGGYDLYYAGVPIVKY